MDQKKILFSALFLLGTIAAGLGWVLELRFAEMLPPEAMHLIGPLTIAGHALQVIGIFCHLVTPDGHIDEDRDRETMRDHGPENLWHG